MGPASREAPFTDARLPHPQVLWPVGPARSEENDEPVVLGAEWGSRTPRSFFSQILTKPRANWLSSLPLPPQPILSPDLLKCYGLRLAILSPTHCDATVPRLSVFLIGLLVSVNLTNYSFPVLVQSFPRSTKSETWYLPMARANKPTC